MGKITNGENNKWRTYIVEITNIVKTYIVETYIAKNMDDKNECRNIYCKKTTIGKH